MNWDDPDEFFDDDWTVDITIADRSYKAIPFDKSFSKSVINAGLSDGVSMSYMLKTSDFITLPTVGALVTINETEYRIQSPVKIDSTSKTFTIDLSEKYG